MCPPDFMITTDAKRLGHPPDSELPSHRQLRDAIEQRRVVVVVGAGVSASATARAPCSTWPGLLRDGLEYCASRGLVMPTAQRDWIQRLEKAGAEDMTELASLIQGWLGGREHPVYQQWLRDAIRPLQPRSTRLIRAILNLGCPVATTNYDNLLCQVSGLNPILWTQEDAVHRFLTGQEPGILHLHGHFYAPETVIFSNEDYQRLLGQASLQHLQRTLATVHSLLFVGCGATTEDPNVGRLIASLSTLLAKTNHINFRLEVGAQVPQRQAQHEGTNIRVLSYGERYEDLPPYLDELAGPGRVQPPAMSAILAWASHRNVVGRDEILSWLDKLLASHIPVEPPPDIPPVVYLFGPPGVGKTAIAETFLLREHQRTCGRRPVVAISFDPNVDDDHILAFQQLDDELRRQLDAGTNSGPDGSTTLEPLVFIDNVDDKFRADLTVKLVNRWLKLPFLVLGRMAHLGDDPHGRWRRWEGGVRALGREEGGAAFQMAMLELGQTPVDPEDVMSMVRALGGLPLAIRVACGLVREGTAAAEVVTCLARSQYEATPQDPSQSEEYRGSVYSIRRMVELSVDVLARQGGTSAVKALRALAWGPLAGISRPMGELLTGDSGHTYHEGVRRCRAYSLLERTTHPGENQRVWVQLHPMIAEVLISSTPTTSHPALWELVERIRHRQETLVATVPHLLETTAELMDLAEIQLRILRYWTSRKAEPSAEEAERVVAAMDWCPDAYVASLQDTGLRRFWLGACCGLIVESEHRSSWMAAVRSRAHTLHHELILRLEARASALISDLYPFISYHRSSTSRGHRQVAFSELEETLLEMVANHVHPGVDVFFQQVLRAIRGYVAAFIYRRLLSPMLQISLELWLANPSHTLIKAYLQKIRVGIQHLALVRYPMARRWIGPALMEPLLRFKIEPDWRRVAQRGQGSPLSLVEAVIPHDEHDFVLLERVDQLVLGRVWSTDVLSPEDYQLALSLALELGLSTAGDHMHPLKRALHGNLLYRLWGRDPGAFWAHYVAIFLPSRPRPMMSTPAPITLPTAISDIQLTNLWDMLNRALGYSALDAVDTTDPVHYEEVIRDQIKHYPRTLLPIRNSVGRLSHHLTPLVFADLRAQNRTLECTHRVIRDLLTSELRPLDTHSSGWHVLGRLLLDVVNVAVMENAEVALRVFRGNFNLSAFNTLPLPSGLSGSEFHQVVTTLTRGTPPPDHAAAKVLVGHLALTLHLLLCLRPSTIEPHLVHLGLDRQGLKVMASWAEFTLTTLPREGNNAESLESLLKAHGTQSTLGLTMNRWMAQYRGLSPILSQLLKNWMEFSRNYQGGPLRRRLSFDRFLSSRLLELLDQIDMNQLGERP